MNIMHNKTPNGKVYYAITSRDARRTTYHSVVSKYQLISQLKLNKFQSHCYSKCSKWRPLVSTQRCWHLCHWSTVSSIVVAETRESVVGYKATRVRCPST